MNSDADRLQILHSMNQINRQDWNKLAHQENYDPFLDWDFLQALEQSQSVCNNTGWLPHHLTLHSENGQLIAAMPLYLKLHSQGEFVFDHQWAEAFALAGGRYYPKLLSAVPFTPVTGRRLLTKPEQKGRADLLVKAMTSLAQQNNISSCHINFIRKTDSQYLEKYGFLLRENQQFHWHNHDYHCFEDFLAQLASRKRKNLKKERSAAQQGLIFETLTGPDLKEQHWDVFFDFYQNTGARKWGQPYLNREFFSLLHQRMTEKILLILAKSGNTYIAGALNLIGSDTLYGRYWGRTQTQPFLHFEICYYQAMDFAIANKLKRVEAGAQGTHKLARGYEPVITHSAHWIAHHGLRNAVKNFLQQETHIIRHQNAGLNSHTPFSRKTTRNKT